MSRVMSALVTLSANRPPIQRRSVRPAPRRVARLRVEELDARVVPSLNWGTTALDLFGTDLGAAVTPNGNFFASDGFDIDRSASNTLVEYNYAHDNQGGGVLLTGAVDSVIRFNIFENNGQGALTFYGKAPSRNTATLGSTVVLLAAPMPRMLRRR